jgi:hypothetical protein
MYRNAQIFSAFLGPKGKRRSLNVQTVLKEKGFYEAALRSEDPYKTIKILAGEKENNPSYSVRDALRQVKDLKKNSAPLPDIPDQPDYLEPNYKRFLIDLEASLVSFRNTCPRDQFLVRIDSWIRQTRYERARTPANDFKAVRDQVDQGACTAEEVADEVCLSPAEIKAFFVQIVGCVPPRKDSDPREAGSDYEWRPIGVNTEMAKGTRACGIFRKDQPAGDEFTMPGYRPVVEYGDDEEHF